MPNKIESQQSLSKTKDFLIKEEKSKEEQFEYHIRDFTTNVCNMIQGCLADEHPIMEQKLREHFLRSTKTLKKNIYKMFNMTWDKGKREDKKPE